MHRTPRYPPPASSQGATASPLGSVRSRANDPTLAQDLGRSHTRYPAAAMLPRSILERAVVAGRAAAPVVATPLVQWALRAGGVALALRVLGVYVAAALLPAAFALRKLDLSNKGCELPPMAPMTPPPATQGPSPPPPQLQPSPSLPTPVSLAPPPASRCGQVPPARTVSVMWLALLCGSGPGLLCHGHAAAMMALCATRGAMCASPASASTTASLRALGISGMAVGSVIGRMGGGMIIDVVSARLCLIVLPLATAAVVLGPLIDPTSVPLTFAALVSCGLTYGLNAVALPVVTARIYGPDRMQSVYGTVFTAWGVGGILAPWLAGRLFDFTGGYAAALMVSAISLLVAGLCAIALPRELPREGASV